MSDPKRLKEEGDGFFKSENYSGAYEKYTKAIELDPSNAILHCNRSACSFALGRFVLSPDLKASLSQFML